MQYSDLEKLRPDRPVDRIEWIASQCSGKTVLDLGCYDETGLFKRDTELWLHGRIARQARTVIGVDSSSKLPPEGIESAPNARIYRGNVMQLGALPIPTDDVEVIVAGELIEHLTDTLEFFRHLKAEFPGRMLIASTPNASSLTNVLLALTGRESCHPDHLQIYSYKTINTLCLRSGLSSWRIVPYHALYSELLFRSSGTKRVAVRCASALIRGAERLFPLLSGGLILQVGRL